MTTLQKPIGSGFGAAAAAGDVMQNIYLSGKIAIVTGGASGIGTETTRALRSAGARGIVPARNPEKAQAALSSIDGVEVESMDLTDPASIDAFAERFLASGQPLHILMNNAGVMAAPLIRDLRGYESQFATNHLGHFQLTTRLLPALRGAHGARVVAVSSLGHRRSPVVFEDPNFERRDYDPLLAYGQSKTANILFALALDEREKAAGVRAFSLHPGGIFGPGMEKYLSAESLRAAGMIDENGKPIFDLEKGFKTAEQGAATSLWCATSPQLDGMGGVYCENSDIAPIMPDQGQNGLISFGVMPFAVDPESADRLWSLSEQLLGCRFGA
jgi:NAD(P)-dependent dehydrogenase (short-subunit alcohol dehydrogenase family)